MLYFVYLVCLIEVLCGLTAGHPIVKTPLGDIVGLTVSLPTGKVVDAFLGIPYALPPIGQNRFSPAQPVAPWNGTLQAQSKSPPCYQGVSEEEKRTLWFATNLTESEDCLYLNVWRPSEKENGKMAVLVWIHPGGLYAGSSVMPLYDGSILATEENVLVISMNFRQSVLGQLYLDISDAPGNVVLRDQILALEWVRSNVESFGGDPDKVTLFGESGGAIAVGYHLTNPEVMPLFRSAILQSGSPNDKLLDKSPEFVLNASLELAASLGCPYQNVDMHNVLDCLRRRNVSDLMAPFNYIPDYFQFKIGPIRNGKEVCVDLQSCALEIPNNQRKPILIGTVKNEFNFFQKYVFPGISYNEDTVITEEDWKNLIHVVYGLQDMRLVDVAMEVYQEPKNYNPAQVREVTGSFFSDSFMICPSVGFAEQYSSASAGTYMYSYAHPLSKPRAPMPLWAGTVHGDEIPYLFGAPVDPANDYLPKEAKLSREVMAYWAQFAKTSDPNGANPKRTFWPKFDGKNQAYLILDLVSYTSNNFKRKECSFWSKIYPELVSLQKDLIVVNKSSIS